MTDSNTPTGGALRVTPYVDVHAQARHLGLMEIEGAAILPRNFAAAESQADLSHESTASTMTKLLAQEGVCLPRVQPKDGGRLPFTVEFDAQAVIPVVVFCVECFSVLAAVGKIVNVLWNRASARTKIHFQCVVQRESDSSFVHLDWSGPPSEAPDMEAVIQELHDGSRTPDSTPTTGEPSEEPKLSDDGPGYPRENDI